MKRKQYEFIEVVNIGSRKRMQNAPQVSLAPSKAIMPKPPLVAEGSQVFPCYSAGRVFIHLDITNARAGFQLHRAVLERQSSWFANEFQKSDSITDSIRFLFYLKTCEHKPPLLVQSYEHDVKSVSQSNYINPQKAKAAQHINDTISAKSSTTSSDTIKDESIQSRAIVDLTNRHSHNNGLGEKREAPAQDSVQNSSVANSREQHEYHRSKTAHRWLLGMYYNLAPYLSTTDIDEALTQCEEIVRIANYYGSLPTVRPYLGNALSQFRQGLYHAIARDPPRWLLLSVKLELGATFSEAMIHCAGVFPYSLWPTDVNTLPENLLTTIKAKARDLAFLRSQVSIELHMNTLAEAEGGPAVSLLSAPEAWAVVQMFRDWLAHQERNLRQANKLYDGRHFRKIRKGREAYLPSKLMVTLLEEAGLRGILKYNWDAVEDDLNCLKDYAQQAVESLMKNNLMVDPEVGGITYLTCVQVDSKDYPWIQAVPKGL
ncbi:hypothetical protein MMC13_007286 [Lambiella insularis]|nr:hypothetical protein [Lambiella insularis]